MTMSLGVCSGSTEFARVDGARSVITTAVWCFSDRAAIGELPR
jgi:hypothetical protein